MYVLFLQGSLPLVMMFDLPDHLEIDDSEVQKIQDELDVGISIKPKQRQSNKSVMIKAQVRLPCTYRDDIIPTVVTNVDYLFILSFKLYSVSYSLEAEIGWKT